MKLPSYLSVPYDFLLISASRLYAVIDRDEHYVARGLEYYEAAAELLTVNDCEYAIRPDGDRVKLHWGPRGKLRSTRITGDDEDEILRQVIRRSNIFGNYRVVEEELTCKSWWEFARTGDLTVYAWGDEDQAAVVRDYLDSQREDGDSVEFEMRELGLREAFVLRKEDGEHWYDLGDLIHSKRTMRQVELADAIQSIAQCAARVEDAGSPSLLEVHVASAIRIDRQLAALEDRESEVREEIINLLGKFGWSLHGVTPAPLNNASV